MLSKAYRQSLDQTLSDRVVIDFLSIAAHTGAEKLEKMIAAGEVEEDRQSFGCVILNPTQPRAFLPFLSE
jgi:hypothetical protein